jgi:hypothetical protein
MKQAASRVVLAVRLGYYEETIFKVTITHSLPTASVGFG